MKLNEKYLKKICNESRETAEKFLDSEDYRIFNLLVDLQRTISNENYWSMHLDQRIETIIGYYVIGHLYPYFLID